MKEIYEELIKLQHRPDLELVVMDLLVIVTMQVLHDFRSHPGDARNYVRSTQAFCHLQRMKMILD
jgi:hypothetical protein